MDAAFEQPKEIPAPLRVWLARIESDRLSRAALTILLAMPAIPLGLRGSPLFLALPPLFYAGYFLGSEALRARRLLRSGFTLADLRAALHAHWLRRREELEYESRTFDLTPRTASRLAAAGFALALVASPFITPAVIGAGTPWALLALGIGLTLGTVGAIAAVVDTIRRRLGWGGHRAGATQLKFWDGRWGERLARLASLGLTTTPNTTSAPPQFTEVALGRATDALFEALPKHLKKELKDIPSSVRRLESDAKSLRETLDRLDEAIAAAARVAHDGGQSHERLADDAELQRRRDLAAERLAATVTALESIRLGLLRLRIGTAPVASVTEALEAASRVGRDISIVIAAEHEAEQALAPKRA